MPCYFCLYDTRAQGPLSVNKIFIKELGFRQILIDHIFVDAPLILIPNNIRTHLCILVSDTKDLIHSACNV